MKETLKIKLGDLIKKKTALKKITSHENLDFDVMIDIERKIRSIITEFKTYEECQKVLIKRYGEYGGATGKINEKNAPKYLIEVANALDKEIEIEYERISLKKLKDQGINLSIDDYTELKDDFLLNDIDKKEKKGGNK